MGLLFKKKEIKKKDITAQDICKLAEAAHLRTIEREKERITDVIMSAADHGRFCCYYSPLNHQEVPQEVICWLRENGFVVKPDFGRIEWKQKGD